MDRSRVKTTPQWKQQDREWEKLHTRRLARYRVWSLLLLLIAKDAKLKSAWRKHVKQVEHKTFRDWLAQQLK